MNQNIASLAKALEELGFDTSLSTTLQAFVLLQLPKFSISYKAVKGKDVLKCNLFFERKEKAFSCLCYDAILRKEIILPDLVVEGVSLKELDDKMNSVNWKDIFTHAQDIDFIIDDLQKLTLSKEGKEFSEQLKVKHWSDTSLERILNISFLKPKFEITQRFYFIDDKSISIEEAYRFLNNKWIERQMKKKLPDVPGDTKTNDKSKASKNARKRKEGKE
jgi:hypothetical protein